MKKRESKLGQVTVFVIIAIAILSTIVIVFFAINKGGNSLNNFSNDPVIQSKFLQIKTSVYDCIKFTSETSLDVIGYQGGYSKRPENFLDFGFIFIPYYYRDGEIMTPSDSEVEKQLGAYVDDNLISCINGINKSDFELELLSPETKVEIHESEVVFSVDLPLTIKHGENSALISLKDSPVSVPSKLFDILNTSRYIVNLHKTQPDTICISCIDRYSKERGIFVDITQINTDNSTSLFILSENTTKPDFYIFEFLNKYAYSSQ